MNLPPILCTLVKFRIIHMLNMDDSHYSKNSEREFFT